MILPFPIVMWNLLLVHWLGLRLLVALEVELKPLNLNFTKIYEFSIDFVAFVNLLNLIFILKPILHLVSRKVSSTTSTNQLLGSFLKQVSMTASSPLDLA